MYLGALIGRLMPCRGWVAGERHAGAEPLVTGRCRPYDESTLRKKARELAQHGGTEHVARAVEASVERAVGDSGTKAVAYTDIYDGPRSPRTPRRFSNNIMPPPDLPSSG